MKRKKILFTAIAALAIATTGIIYASDHIDAPNIVNQTTDITDLYAFQSPTTSTNMVFVANTQGLLTPATTGAAKFDPNTLIQISIDNTGDNIEDLVIQCIYDASSNKILMYGPVKPTTVGLQSKLEGSVIASVGVTPYGSAPVISTTNGISLFAGPRDDPFFFDLDQYHAVLAGTATAFRNPGVDAFAGTNVMSVVVELPKSMLGGTGKLNVWLTTRKKI